MNKCFGRIVKLKRGDRSIREAAKEIGTSHSTLSRIENGKFPDIETFKKICIWAKIDANDALEMNDDSKLKMDRKLQDQVEKWAHIETFKKICIWAKIDANDALEMNDDSRLKMDRKLQAQVEKWAQGLKG